MLTRGTEQNAPLQIFDRALATHDTVQHPGISCNITNSTHFNTPPTLAHHPLYPRWSVTHAITPPTLTPLARYQSKHGTHAIHTSTPPTSGLSMNILRAGDKSRVQRIFFTNSAGDLLPAQGFLGGLYNFCNFLITFSLM